MPSLPRDAFKLRGGCFCNAIKYTISVPELAQRPLIPNPPSKPLGTRNEVHEHLPAIFIDHCNSCRRTVGSILQAWFLCPQAWVEPELESRAPESHSVKPAVIDFVTPDEALQELTFVKGFKSSEYCTRTFCGKCGTHLTFHYSGPNQEQAEKANWGPYFDITLGSLDEASAEIEGVRPDRQVWAANGIEWVKQLVLDGESSLRDAKEQNVHA
jgi:hypothetical protein